MTRSLSNSLEFEDPTKRPSSPTHSVVIRTSDLVPYSQALQLSGSPSSFRSQATYLDDDAMKSMVYRTRQQPETPSGAIPIPKSKETPRSSFLGTSPRPEPGRLAPDSYGNEIQPDAKWTRINRKLVSPEVLDQDGRRYEA